MTARLPIVGEDNGDWGTILNDFLLVSHDGTGMLTGSAVAQAGALMASQLGSASGVASLGTDGHVPTAQLGSGLASASNFLRGDGVWSVPNGGSSALAQDSDVSITSPQNNQVLTYNSTAGAWENETAAVVSVFGRTGAVTAQSGDYTAAEVGALPSTETLNAIAAANATSGSIAMNGNKITGLANGAASSDAAAFGQIPTASTGITNTSGAWSVAYGTSSSTAAAGNDSRITGALQSGATAGGDLSGSYPNPTLSATTNVESIISANSTVTSKAPLASPTFTGTPTAPTATAGTNTTQLATTAFVSAAVTSGAAGDATALALGLIQLDGDLGGSATSPTVESIKGIILPSSAPTGAGQVLTSSSTSATTWSTPAASIALDSTASDIQALGTQAAGSTGKAADAGHVHPTTGLALLSGASFTGGVNPSVITLTYGSTVSVNAAQGNDFRISLTGSGATIATPTNPTDGQRITFQVTQDSTGSRTVTWQAGGYNFGTNGTPALSTAANLTDVIGFIYNATIGQWLAAGAALGF